jgi:hypothetical protein
VTCGKLHQCPAIVEALHEPSELILAKTQQNISVSNIIGLAIFAYAHVAERLINKNAKVVIMVVLHGLGSVQINMMQG